MARDRWFVRLLAREAIVWRDCPDEEARRLTEERGYTEVDRDCHRIHLRSFTEDTYTNGGG